MNKNITYSVFDVRGIIYKVAETGQKAFKALKSMLPHHYTESTLNFYARPKLVGFETNGVLSPADLRPHWERRDDNKKKK